MNQGVKETGLEGEDSFISCEKLEDEKSRIEGMKK